MKRLLAILLLLIPEICFAQSTTVTLSVTDTPDSQSWNSGTYQTFLIGAQTPSWPGGAITITSAVSPLSATGTASFSLPDNNTILPSGTQWRIQVCTATLPARCFSQTLTITGSAQPVALAPPSPRFTVPNTPQGGLTPITAYANSEIVGGWVGFQYTNIGGSTPAIQVCQAVTGNTCTTWGGSGGITSPNFPPAPLGYYLSPNCKDLGITNPFCFNTPADTQISNICNYTSGSAVVTCATFMEPVTATVNGSNVATYTINNSGSTMVNPNTASTGGAPTGWAIGNSITISGFVGGDTFFNQTCTISSLTTTSVSCSLVHASASSTSFGAVLNTSAGPFVAGDVGKRIFGYASCAAYTQLAGGTNHNNPIATSTSLTIASFQSSAQITMSGNAANSVAANNTSCVIWGHPDDTGAAAMDAAMYAAPSCPVGHLSAANYLYTAPHHLMNPYGCAYLPSLNAGGSAGVAGGGNMFYPSGFLLVGREQGPTTVYMPPAFPETGSCTNGKSGKACFVVCIECRWSGIQLSGGGNYSSPNFTSGNILLEISGPGEIDHVACTNFGGGTTGTFGVGSLIWGQLQEVILSACGDTNLGLTAAATTGFRVSLDNCYTFCAQVNLVVTGSSLSSNALVDKYSFICYDCFMVPGLIPLADNIIRDSIGVGIKLYHTKISFFDTATNGDVGYLCAVSGCSLDMEDTYMDATANGTLATTGDFGIFCSAACTVTAKNSLIKGSTSGGSAYKDAAGSILNDMGGNTWGGGVPFTTLGSVNADGHSLKAVCTGTATSSSTLALISSGLSLTGTGLTTACTGTTLDKGIQVNGARTLQNLICTSSATTVSVACTVMTSHNGGAFASSGITCTMTAATRCADGTHSLVVADGDFVTVQIVTGAAETGANVKAFVEWN